MAKGNMAIYIGANKLQEQIDIIEKELTPALESRTKKIEKSFEGICMVL
ncbi:hypothetical protein [Gilliamella sp. Gris1-4]|nr:hypothetical protein [Gilliamella apicola]